MGLAYDGVFRNTKTPADFGGGMPLIPERTEANDRFLGPIHLVVSLMA
jgi:hypothetical protein